jgi:hypothetical protein
MQHINPTTKAIRSALVGLATAAVVIGAVVYGGTVTAALRGDSLQASYAARASFAQPAVAPPSVLTVRTPRTPIAQPITPITYRVAELTSDDGESQED